MLLASLSCEVKTGHVWSSSRKYRDNYRNRASWRSKLKLCLWVGASPVKATLTQLHRSDLLMLQELSAKWQMAVSQRGYCKFRAGSFWKHQPLQELLIDAHLAPWLQTLPGFPFSPHRISATLSDPSCWEESSSVKLLSIFKVPEGKHLLFA